MILSPHCGLNMMYSNIDVCMVPKISSTNISTINITNVIVLYPWIRMLAPKEGLLSIMRNSGCKSFPEGNNYPI